MASIGFKQWLLLSERTLYHGTIVDYEDSIRRLGLHGGVGKTSFVNNAYPDRPDDDNGDRVVFMADKNDLEKSLSAIVHHVSEKLGKDFHGVNDNDIRNNGLLVIVQDEEGRIPQAGDDIGYTPYPHGVEPYDYYASSAAGTKFVKGAALLRLMSRYGVWPRTWGQQSSQRHDLVRGEIGRRAVARHPDKTPQQVTARVQSLRPGDADHMLGQYRRRDDGDEV